MYTRHLRLVLVALILATLSCAGPGSTPTLDRSDLATSVAATLTSAAPLEPHGTTPDMPKAPILPTITPTSPPPSVLRIVYTNGGNIWLIEGVNPPTQLTSSGGADQVLISSDGMKVAFIRHVPIDGQAEIRSVNIDGSGEIALLSPAQFDSLYPLGDFLHHDLSSIAFVPGTHNLMLNTRAISEGPGLIKHDDLLLLDADTGILTTLFSPGSGGDFLLSPDGSQAAIITPNGISLINRDGTNLRPNLVTYPPVITYSEFQYYAQPVWAPDSGALGVAIPSPDPFVPTTTGTIWRIPADGGSPMNMGTISGGFYFSQPPGSCLLSYNLNRVAFLRDTAMTNIHDLYLANANGSGETLYATGDIQWVGWSPDNTHFIYSFSSPMSLHLGVDGGAPTPIGSCSQLEWIDNTQFLCLSGSYGAWTLMRGEISVGLIPIVSPAGNFVSFDLDA